MCTLIALYRYVPGFPLVVAANRDEYYARPAEGPRLRLGPRGPVLAPLDLREGGTWLGLSRAGVLAALTNRPCPEPDPERRSRGLLVQDALAAASAAEAARSLEALPEAAYNPFNLFVADRERAFTVTYGETPRVLELAPGVHVVGNADPTAPPTPKLRRLGAAAARAAAASGDAVLERLAELCRHHEPGDDPFGSTCVHTPAYGTRSSALLCISDFATGDAFRFAEGAPCENEYEDLTPLLRALGGGHRQRGGDAAMRTAS